MTEKQRLTKRAKRRKLIWIIVVPSIFIGSISSLVVAILVSGESESLFDLFMSVALGLFLLGIFVTCYSIWEVKDYRRVIESYCPKCDTPSLKCSQTKREKSGIFMTRTVTSPATSYKYELTRETKYFRCTNCNYEISTTRTFKDD